MSVDATSKSIRMKNRLVSWSPNCWLSMMLPPCRTRNPVTAYTMPGRSGQTSVSTKSPDGMLAFVESSLLMEVPACGNATRGVASSAFVVCDTQQVLR